VIFLFSTFQRNKNIFEYYATPAVQVLIEIKGTKMKKTISSAMTFVMKIVFPTLWLGGFGTGTIAMMTSNRFENQTIVFIAAMLIAAVLFYILLLKLKVVKMDDHKLYVSNFFTEIEIDKHNIVKVTENRFISTHPVWIHLNQPSEFGNIIMFMPKQRMFSLFSSHPIVEELKRFAGIHS
jgi:hypothetical protein